jgi:methylenetetrahydrofolate reductase (NADPH)
MKSYRIELPAVKQDAEDLPVRLERFAIRYRKALDAGHIVCLTDNALGKIAFQGHELIEYLDLPVPQGKVMVHLNTFHTLKELHEIVDACARLGVADLLVVSGDGSSRQSRLEPEDIHAAGAVTVTSVELLGYLRKVYGSAFRYGVAFNPYEPPEHEMEKLGRKLAAGAEFIITQPVLSPSPAIDALRRISPVPLHLEAWMSPNIGLLTQCIGIEPPVQGAFDPMATLRDLERAYPETEMYLALLDFKNQFPQLTPSGDPT